MNKLISKNPILQFKLGLKILKFLNAGQLTYHGNPVMKVKNMFIPLDPITKKYNANIQLTNAELDTKIGKGNSNGRIYKSADGNWYLNGKRVVNFINSKPNKRTPSQTASTGNSFKTAFNAARNANQREFEWNGTKYNTRRNGETEEQWLNNIGASSNTAPTLSSTYVRYATPETSKVQNVNLNWTYRAGNTSGGFVPTQSSALQSVTLQLDEGPSFYGEGLTDFNRGSIRGFRNLDGGFRNVDEYYTWLNNNQNSDQYKLWNNVLEGMDDETRRNTFNQIMNQFGISGNLGRRDSGRLAEVLNTLRDLGVNGSVNLKAFMNSYNTALNNELAEGRRNASPITSYTEQFRNLILNSKPSLATPPFIAIPRYDENGRPLTYSYKQGGLISKNPVEQFKSKDLTKYQLGGWLKRMITGKPSKGGTYGGGRSGGGATTSWDTETEDTTKEEKKKRYTIVQSKKLKSKKDLNKENNSKPKVTSKSKVASSNKPNLIDLTLSEIVVTAQRPEIAANFATQPNMEISPIAVPQVPRHYNRKQTREYIRTKGLNPYHMGSLQRRQLRHYLNGELTDEQVSPTILAMANSQIIPDNKVYNTYYSNGLPKNTIIADTREFFRPA